MKAHAPKPVTQLVRTGRIFQLAQVMRPSDGFVLGMGDRKGAATLAKTLRLRSELLEQRDRLASGYAPELRTSVADAISEKLQAEQWPAATTSSFEHCSKLKLLQMLELVRENVAAYWETTRERENSV